MTQVYSHRPDYTPTVVGRKDPGRNGVGRKDPGRNEVVYPSKLVRALGRLHDRRDRGRGHHRGRGDAREAGWGGWLH